MSHLNLSLKPHGVPLVFIFGEVTERRALETKETKKIWMYALKVAAKGVTCEIQTKDPVLYDQCPIGIESWFETGMDLFAGKVNYVLRRVIDPATLPADGPVIPFVAKKA